MSCGDSFQNLLNGIYATGATVHLMPVGVGVDGAVFNANTVGTYFNGADKWSVVRSRFTMGNAFEGYGTACDQNIGILAREASFNSINENAFHGSGSFEKFGIVAENVGEDNHFIYRDTFSNLDYGCFLKGDHYEENPYGLAPHTGLHIRCNTFTGNDTDVVGYGGPQSGQPAHYWRLGEPDTSAGNIFPTNGGVIRHYGGASVQYFYKNSNSLPASRTGYLAFPAQYARSCPSNFSPPSGGNASTVKRSAMVLQHAGERYEHANVYRQSLATTLAANIDMGSTANLLSFIEQTHDGQQMKDELMNASPYCSETVLRAAVEKDVMDLEQTLEVLVAHPELLRAQGFLAYLENEAPSILPSEAMEVLFAAAAEISVRGEDEGMIRRYADSAAAMFSLLVTDLSFDTSMARSDSLGAWYAHKPTVHARLTQAAFHTSRRQYNDADNVYADLSDNYGLSGQRLAEVVGMWRIDSLMRELHDDGRPLTDLAPDEAAMLNGLIADNAGLATFTAAKIVGIALNSIQTECIRNGNTYFPFYPIRRHRSSRFGTSNPDFPRTANKVEASPNPAYEAVLFSYHLPIRKGSAHLTVSDATGRRVYRTTLAGGDGQAVWNVRALAPGTYLYTVRDERRELASGKIVVAR